MPVSAGRLWSASTDSKLGSFGQIHMRVAGTLNPHKFPLASFGDFLARILKPYIPVQLKSGSFGASDSPSFVFQTAYCLLPTTAITRTDCHRLRLVRILIVADRLQRAFT
jgi:hypothetical protein